MQTWNSNSFPCCVFKIINRPRKILGVGKDIILYLQTWFSPTFSNLDFTVLRFFIYSTIYLLKVSSHNLAFLLAVLKIKKKKHFSVYLCSGDVPITTKYSVSLRNVSFNVHRSSNHSVTLTLSQNIDIGTSVNDLRIISSSLESARSRQI